ncbi:MAG: glycoside hydrolase family 3 C-terminal domain-containing protein [Odoribacteraceae bacterium]|jgi:beta-glucosidase|nr:glycoside hydrolase family 3 C-terminal domain-containing protein [Odoribacteraceae bacterium]
MKKILITALTVALLVACASLHASGQVALPLYADDTRPVEERVEDALARLTLEEKIALLHGQATFSSAGVPRLGIPELWMSDGPHGVRAEVAWSSFAEAHWTNDSCTAFPALTALAATFNPDMAYLYGKAIGEEARYRKKDVLLGPGVNIYRTPLNGRNFEYMGEDPYLASVMVVPYVRGVQENGVAACVKHFALNNQEEARTSVDVRVNERALREIYLPAFHAAVTGGNAWAIMGAYNRHAGEYCCHNERLLQQILKQEWGFTGVVISDWGGTHDTHEAALKGLDIEMGTRKPFTAYYLADSLLAAVRRGEIDEKVIDEKARRVLRLITRTVMNTRRPWGSFATSEHAETGRRVAEEGIVLLKNDGALLPIDPSRIKTIAVIGENATRRLTIGGGSSELKVKREISPLEGLRERLGGRVKIVHAAGYASGPPAYGRVLPAPGNADALREEAVKVAANAELVLFFGGLNKNYRQDSEEGDRLDYNLPFGQDRLIEELLAVNKNVVVVLLSGNAVAMPWIRRVPAIVQAWYGGSEAGNAIARVLDGTVNPSGKLPFTFPVRLEDNAAHAFGTTAYPGENGVESYLEDILVGYRWHDTRRVPPLFAFGHGLSYTTFEYGKPSTDKKTYARDEVIRVRFALRNNGKMAGSEVAQLYVSAPGALVPRPAKELKAFTKVALQTGETREVILEIPASRLAYWDETTSGWKIEPGKYTLQTGSSSRDIKHRVTVTIL